MAASQRTASRCTLETARATHAFEIVGYSFHKARGTGNFIHSTTFAAGGYDWRIQFYPDGNAKEDDAGYISIYLELLTKNVEVIALFRMSLVSQNTGRSSPPQYPKNPLIFSTITPNRASWGFDKFMKCSKLEASPYLRDDRLVIECEVTVAKDQQVVETALPSQIQDPPSDLQDNLAKLLGEKKGADATFKVKGEVFHAHKIVLAMRSAVFDAQFYGPVGHKGRGAITIEDMQPDVFKAMLHFIYTDSLPSMDDLDDADREEMIKHLLVAADRYAMERMKKICESILRKSLDAVNVATTLALADHHHCSRLKDACIEFILSVDPMEDVVASQGYVHLKRSCPDVMAELFERSTKSRKS